MVFRILNTENLQTLELEKSIKYELLIRELRLIHKCKINVISYVMTLKVLVTKYHSMYIVKISIDSRIEAFIKSRVRKKTLKVNH